MRINGNHLLGAQKEASKNTCVEYRGYNRTGQGWEWAMW